MPDYTQLYYRFEHYALTNGPKKAGFVLLMPTSTMMELAHITVTPAQKEHFYSMCKQRLNNLYQAKMVKKSYLEHAGVSFMGDTPVPRVFNADPIFGASLGAEAEVFSHLQKPDALAWIGEEMAYTPHNTDSAVASVMMTVLVATWGEWAQSRLYGVTKKSLLTGPECPQTNAGGVL